MIEIQTHYTQINHNTMCERVNGQEESQQLCEKDELGKILASGKEEGYKKKRSSWNRGDRKERCQGDGEKAKGK